MADMPLPPGALSSAATARNTAPILGALAAYLTPTSRVLEVASGAGEHAVAAVEAWPGLHWTPSDPSEAARTSIAAWTAARNLSGRIAPPLLVDVTRPDTWPAGPFDCVLAINMVHISPWEATLGLARLAGRILVKPSGIVALYGPYLEAEIPLADSNAAFDADLRRRNPAWGLRDRQRVTEAFAADGLMLAERIEMPANNLMLVFRS